MIEAPIEIWVEAIGIAAPGLPDWPATRAILRGEAPYQPDDLPPYQPQLLRPNERRRATPAVRQAFRAAESACIASGRAPGEYAAVFTTSDADMSIIDRIGLALADSARIISPIDFHNSVHNAAAGYWSIAVDGRLPSTTLCAYDASFSAGLLEAAVMTVVDGFDSLLVAYDVPAPTLLQPKRAIFNAVSTALTLCRARPPRPCARLQLRRDHTPITTLQDPALENLRRSNPAARALPLLRLLALETSGVVAVEDAGGGSLRIEVSVQD